MKYDKRILSDKVADDLKQMILDKNYEPGDKLPNEIELSQFLNIGRSTLREAIKILVSKHVLEVRRGRGTFVKDKPGFSSDPFGTEFMEEKDLLAYFYEVRAIVEPAIAGLAAKRASQDEIHRIQQEYDKVRQAILKQEDHTDYDIAFHNAIAQASKNPIIERLVPIINEGIQKGYEETKNIPESADHVLHQHEVIMAAIARKDGLKAEEAMAKHIQYGQSKIG